MPDETLNLSGPYQYERLRALTRAIQVAARSGAGLRTQAEYFQWIHANRGSNPDLIALSALPENTDEMNVLMRLARPLAHRDESTGRLSIPTPADVDEAYGRHQRELNERQESLRVAMDEATANYENQQRTRSGHRRSMFWNGFGVAASIALAIAGVSLGGFLIGGAFSALSAGASLTSGGFLAALGLGIFGGKWAIKGIGAMFKKCTQGFKNARKALNDSREQFQTIERDYNRALENYNENAREIDRYNSHGYTPVDVRAYDRGRHEYEDAYDFVGLAPEAASEAASEAAPAPAPAAEEAVEEAAAEAEVTPVPEVVVTPAPEAEVTPAPEVVVTPAPAAAPAEHSDAEAEMEAVEIEFENAYDPEAIRREIEEYNRLVDGANAGTIGGDDLMGSPVGESTFHDACYKSSTGSLASKIVFVNRHVEQEIEAMKLAGATDAEIEKYRKTHGIDEKSIAVWNKKNQRTLQSMIKSSRAKQTLKIELGDPGKGRIIHNEMVNNVTMAEFKSSGNPVLDKLFAGKTLRECSEIMGIILNPRTPEEKEKRKELLGSNADNKVFLAQVENAWRDYEKKHDIVCVQDIKGNTIVLQYDKDQVLDSSQETVAAAIKEVTPGSIFSAEPKNDPTQKIITASRAVEPTEEVRDDTRATKPGYWTGYDEFKKAYEGEGRPIDAWRRRKTEENASATRPTPTTSTVTPVVPTTPAATNKGNSYWDGYEEFKRTYKGEGRAIDAWRRLKAEEKAGTSTTTKKTNAPKNAESAQFRKDYLANNPNATKSDAWNAYRAMKKAQKAEASAARPAEPAEPRVTAKPSNKTNAPKNAEYAAFKEEYLAANPGKTAKDAYAAYRASKKTAPERVEPAPVQEVAPEAPAGQDNTQPQQSAPAQPAAPAAPQPASIKSNSPIVNIHDGVHTNGMSKAQMREMLAAHPEREDIRTLVGDNMGKETIIAFENHNKQYMLRLDMETIEYIIANEKRTDGLDYIDVMLEDAGFSGPENTAFRSAAHGRIRSLLDQRQRKREEDQARREREAQSQQTPPVVRPVTPGKKPVQPQASNEDGEMSM